MKQLMTSDELITHMKEKGITFNEVDENDAKDFLSQNNYYMKLASYRTNYPKHNSGKKNGQYIKLDFGYLKELSTIDMHLRYIIVEMCLDIEHAMKVKLLDKITKNPKEDGYNIVRKFLAQDNTFKNLKQIQSHNKSEYCKDLIDKYYPFFPAWVFVEIISFGTLVYFCDFYNKIYSDEIINNNLMNTVRDLRNAAAHSNCILNNMCKHIDVTKQPDYEITSFVINMKDISTLSRNNNLRCEFVYNMVTLLYVYDKLMIPASKTKRYQQIKDFMNERVTRNKEYFISNTKICGEYRFLKKVVDNL